MVLPFVLFEIGAFAQMLLVSVRKVNSTVSSSWLPAGTASSMTSENLATMRLFGEGQPEQVVGHGGAVLYPTLCDEVRGC